MFRTLNIVTALAVFVVLLLASVAPAGAESKGVTIGVVNITKVFEGYKKKQDLEKELRNTREQKMRTLREKNDQVARLRDEIRMLELGSEERKRKEEELERKQLDLKNFGQVTAGNLVEQKLDITQTLYEEISKVIDAYGKEKGFDLIVKYEQVPIESKSLDELLYKINQKMVMFASERIDITDEILDIINEAYSKEIVEK